MLKKDLEVRLQGLETENNKLHSDKRGNLNKINELYEAIDRLEKQILHEKDNTIERLMILLLRVLPVPHGLDGLITAERAAEHNTDFNLLKNKQWTKTN